MHLNNFNMKNIKTTKLIINRLLKLVFNESHEKIVSKYITFFDKLRKKSGLPFSIKYYKAVKLHITRYICGKPLLSNESGVSITKDGFPTRFLYLKELVDSGCFRVVLTLLTYTRSIIPTAKEYKKVKPDYSTITNPYKGKDWVIPASFIKDFVRNYDLHLPLPVYSDSRHYISAKSSPNGPATWSSM
jgi:hypothetical protein